MFISATLASITPSSPSGVTKAAPSRLALAILTHGVLLGVSADVLLRDGRPGIAVPLWIALAGITLVSLTRRDGRGVGAEPIGWLLTGVLFACGLAWRDSGFLQAFDMIAAIAAFAMAAIALGNKEAALLAEQFRSTAWAAAALVRQVVAGCPMLVLSEFTASHQRGRATSRLLPALRAALIAGVLLVVFGSLLRGADPIFASLVDLPDFDVRRVLSHGFVIGFICWVTSGWALGALGPGLRLRRAPSSFPIELSALDVTTALGTLNVLFSVFVIAQLGWLFGGEAFLHERTGLTAAQYARKGFFEMVWVVLLVTPLLVATRALLPGDRSLARRHTVLSLPLMILLGAIILSAGMRMQLYVRYYGLTVDRFYPMVFMGWLGFVLAWLGVTVLRGRGRIFIAGAAVSGLAVLAGLNVLAPDAFVARFNIARAEHTRGAAGTEPDLLHMSQLSGDTADLATRSVLTASAGVVGTTRVAERERERCYAALTLLRRWGPTSPAALRREADGAWRFWNSGEQAAVRAVRAHSEELRTVQHASCASVPRAERGK